MPMRSHRPMENGRPSLVSKETLGGWVLHRAQYENKAWMISRSNVSGAEYLCELAVTNRRMVVWWLQDGTALA